MINAKLATSSNSGDGGVALYRRMVSLKHRGGYPFGKTAGTPYFNAVIKNRQRNGTTLNGIIAVNVVMVEAYWNVGRLIVEKEQGGEKRAVYGEAVLSELSGRLTAEFSQGFDLTNLRKMRQFYLMFPKRDALRLESPEAQKRDSLRPELSWTHYRLLLRVENKQAREWYVHEAAEEHWSTRQLERQTLKGSSLRYVTLKGSYKGVIKGVKY